MHLTMAPFESRFWQPRLIEVDTRGRRAIKHLRGRSPMLTRKSALGLLVGAALTATIFAATTGAQKPAVTVGDFAVKLSKALGKPVTDQRTAVDSLKSLGVQVGSNLNAGLTEGADRKSTRLNSSHTVISYA